MNIRAMAFTGFISLAAVGSAHATEVALCTDAGRIAITLDEAAAPAQVENFLRYIAEGHFTGTVFHRVIADFMIQGGGFNRNLQQRPAPRSVENESRNGQSNLRGTIAAARTGDPHSASAQFYINLVDNPYLDAKDDEWGYTVFGHVSEGMDVVDAIATLSTGPGGPFPADVPDPLMIIHSAAVVDESALAELDGPDLQAALLARIDAAEETDAPAQALRWIGHYRASCAPAGADLLVSEARNAVAADEPLRARYALEEFFATATQSDRNYAEARQLYAAIATGGADAASAPRIDECNEPAPPRIPDGTAALFDAMIRSQTEVQAFMRSSTAFLECLDGIIDNDAVSPDIRSGAVEQYNDMVDLTRDVGENFNRQVRAFRARQ